MPNRKTHLGEAELEIMQILWSTRQPQTAREILAQLQGEWSYTSGPTSYVIRFDGAYCYVTATAGGYSISNEGPVSIRRDYVVIEYTTGSPVRMPYTYENGALSIYPIET